jgi:HPt (histidine-containing phosphotransfer) domain-containing protein
MQTQALTSVLEHLRITFDFDEEETRKLLKMLHRTLTEAVPVLRREDIETVYQRSHKLHSELHICGHDELADVAANIEAEAKRGVISRDEIEDFISRSETFSSDLLVWLTDTHR